jgi:hypothetical protein
MQEENDWTIVKKKSVLKNTRKEIELQKVEEAREKNIALVKRVPYDVLSLYIGEVLTMESCVKGIFTDPNDIDNPYKNIRDPNDDRISLGEYTKNLHFHTQCECNACNIWNSSDRKYLRENPLDRYQDEFREKNIGAHHDGNKVFYYDIKENDSGNENFIDLDNLPEKGANKIESRLLTLLKREKDPKYIDRYYTDWFKLLIKDRAPFTNDTIILHNVQNIIVKAEFMNSKEIPISEERFNELQKQCNFSLKPYRGSFTYSHVRSIRKRLLDLRFDEKLFPYKKEEKNEGLGNKPFYLYGSNGTEVDVKFINGILTIEILD